MDSKKDNILLDIVSIASNNNMNVESINTYQVGDDTVFDMTLLVENLELLNKFMNAIKNIPECLSIERMFK